MAELVSISLEPHVWQEVLETLEASTKEGVAPEGNKERLRWYERSHAIMTIKRQVPRRRKRAASLNGQQEIEA